jgi:Holliday junction resolvasome RuvABC endonuclease subunit
VILALDIGTKTGYAVGSPDHRFVIAAGTVTLGTPKQLKEQSRAGGERTHDLRYEALYRFIEQMIGKFQITQIVFEDVQFASTPMQAHLWGALRATVWQVNVNNKGIDIQCVPVATLKKFATKSGDADKHDMLRALKLHAMCNRKDDMNLNCRDLDDNAVDAVWLMLYSRMMTETRTPWSSVWDRRNEAKAQKKEKARLKREKRTQVVKDQVLNP